MCNTNGEGKGTFNTVQRKAESQKMIERESYYLFVVVEHSYNVPLLTTINTFFDHCLNTRLFINIIFEEKKCTHVHRVTHTIYNIWMRVIIRNHSSVFNLMCSKFVLSLCNRFQRWKVSGMHGHGRIDSHKYAQCIFVMCRTWTRMRVYLMWNVHIEAQHVRLYSLLYKF